MWCLWREGWISVRERVCERRCEDWWGEGRVRSLAVPGWCGGLESLNGAGPGGWVGESGSGLPVFGAFGWLVRGGGDPVPGFGVILLGAGRAASGSRRALVVIEEGLDMPAVGLRNSI